MYQAVEAERKNRIAPISSDAPIHLGVIGDPIRTAAKTGISHHETAILDASFRVLRQAAARRRGQQLWYVVVSAPWMARTNERRLRDLIREVRSRITDEMRRAGIKLKLFVEVLECDGGLHSNIVLVGPESVVRALERSPKFSALNDNRGTFIYVRDVPDSQYLNNYLKYEGTSKAHYRDKRAYPRGRGPHLLGHGGGDRVRPSRDLERILHAQDIKPRKRTYASRNIPNNLIVPEPQRQPVIYQADAHGQLALFDTPPVLVNLANFRGRLSPSAAKDLEARRRQRGLTQRQLGQLAGLSQPQIANVVAGRFGLSEDAAARLHAVLNEAA